MASFNKVEGLERASDGWLTLRGDPVTGPRRDVGVVFQEPRLTVDAHCLVPDILRAPLPVDIRLETEQAPHGA